jgi:Flp pilus assembly protein TadB
MSVEATAPLLARLGAVYRRSRAGRRLERRLQRAMIATTPERWRLGQSLVALPVILAAIAVAGPGLGVALGLGAVRVGGHLVLRARQGRRAMALQRGAPFLARSLGAELAAGVSVEQALAAADAALPDAHAALRPLIRAAVLRTALGAPPGLELAAAAHQCEAGGAGLTAVATLLSIHGQAGGDPGSFDRLAAVLEAALATRDEARALTAEARMAAVAVPALAAVLGATLVLTEPAVATGLTSPLAATVLCGCVAAAVAGATLARRLASVS